MLSALRNFAITFLIAALIFGIFAFLVGGALLDNSLSSSSVKAAGGIDVDEIPDADTSEQTSTSGNTGENPSDINGNSFNVLFIGSDYQKQLETGGKYNIEDKYDNGLPRERNINPQTDMLLVMRVDKENRSFTFCQIPTNIRVVKDGKYTELREIHGDDSIDTLVQYVAAYSGVKIDYYVQTDIERFASFISTFTSKLGGFSYTVPCDMKYEDPSQNLVIDLEKGQKIKSADDVLGLFRYNGYTKDHPTSKLTRHSVTTDFMMSMFEYYTSSEKSKNLEVYLDLFDALTTKSSPKVNTNITALDIRNNLDLLLSYNAFTVNTVTYPGKEIRYSSRDKRDPSTESTLYFEPDIAEAIRLLG